MGNRVAQILELIPASNRGHVVNKDNLADCALRGMFPSELLTHYLWWEGPSWLKSRPSEWSKNNLPFNVTWEDEELNTTTCTLEVIEDPLIYTCRQAVVIQSIQMNHCLDHQIPLQLQGENSSYTAQYWSSGLKRSGFSRKSLVYGHSKDTLFWRAKNPDQRSSEDSLVKQALYSQPPCWWSRNTESWWETTEGQILL